MAVWSTVLKSDLSSDFRIDAEYYRPEALALRKRIHDAPFSRSTLAGIADSIINFGAYSLCNDIVFQEDGVRFITAENIHEGYIDFGSCRFIRPDQHEGLLWKSKVRPGQVLVAMAARLGFAAVYEGTERLNSSQDIAKITLSDATATDPYYVAAYINSQLGRGQLLAAQTGSVQQHTNLGRIKDLILVIPPINIQRQIGVLFREAGVARERGLMATADAEAILTAALGLDRVDLTPRLFYEDTFANAAGAGRFDAEYFSPRMQNVIEILSADGKTIGDVAPLAKRRFKPVPGTSFDYIEIADIGTAGTAESSTVPGEEAPSRATWIVKPGDIITTTVRPVRRLSALILPEQNDFVCSSGFAVLRPRDIEPELLLTYLRLPLVAELLDLHTTASMYPAISTADLLRIPFRLPDAQARAKIVAKVLESFAARADSRRLLDEAKRTVETAIMKGGKA